MYLKEAGFKHGFKDMDIPPTESYLKEIGDLEIEIEFLTDSATQRIKIKTSPLQV